MERMSDFEATASHWIHLVGICIEIFGVFIIVAGVGSGTKKATQVLTANGYQLRS